jgi:hypothetical protein
MAIKPMRAGIAEAVEASFDEGMDAMLAFYGKYHAAPNVEAVVCRIVSIAEENADFEWFHPDVRRAILHARPLVEAKLVVPERLLTDRNGVRPELERLPGRWRP